MSVRLPYRDLNENCESNSEDDIFCPSVTCSEVKCGDIQPIPNKITNIQEPAGRNKITVSNPQICKDPPRPNSRRWRCKPAKKPESVRLEPILQQPVGVSFGTFNIKEFLESGPSAKNAEKSDKPEKDPEELLLLQSYATCLIALGETYITPEDEWTSHTINRVLSEGKKHLQKSFENLKEDRLSIELIPKCFNLCGNSMEVEISQPILIGRVECENSRVYSLEVGISMFLNKYKYALLRTEEKFYLTWKSSTVFFLFDCFGRGLNLWRDVEQGNAALICVCSPKGIDALLFYMGGLKSHSAYTIYEIRMKRLIPCCKEPIICTGAERKQDFEAMSDDHARLLGVCHIGSECFGNTRYKQALVVGLISIVYSKIDGPCTWDAKILDKVIILGDRYFKKWTGYNPEKCLTIEELPREFELGQFRVWVAFQPEAATGDWTPRAHRSTEDIVKSIKDVFDSRQFSGILVQVDGKVYAIFLRHGFYYLFDPYPPNILEATKRGPRLHASLHMFTNLQLLCCILTQEVLNLSLPSKFVIHLVKIVDLVKSSMPTPIKKSPPLCSKKEIQWDLPEIASLNESLYDIHCEPLRKCAAEELDIGAGDLDIPPFTEFEDAVQLESESEGEYENLSDLGEGMEEEEMEDENEEEGDEEEDSDEEKGSRGRRKKGKSGKSGKSKKRKGTGKDSSSSDGDGEDGKKRKKKGKDRNKSKSKKDKNKDKSKKDKSKKNKKSKKGGKKGKKKGGSSSSSDESTKEKNEEVDSKGKSETNLSDKIATRGSAEEVAERLAAECIPSSYPGYTNIPRNLAVVGSESGTYRSLCQLLRTGFQATDRVLVMTPWGNYVVFQSAKGTLFLYNGCTCNPCRFRNVDVSIGTSGLLCFASVHDVIMAIIKDKDQPRPVKEKVITADEIIEQYA